MHDRGEIRALTGLRGLAACAVVAYHFFGHVAGDRPAVGMLGPVLRHGYLAVDLFFVLSGFVMALTYGPVFRAPLSDASWGGIRAGTFGSFIAKRIGRVYPLFLAMTLAKTGLVAAGLIDQPAPAAATMLTNVLMIQTWGFAHSIVETAWSISTEFAAYLLFPMLVAIVLAGRRGGAVGTACVAAVALALVASRGTAAVDQVTGLLEARNGPLDVYEGTTFYPLLRCLAGFSLGMVAFRAACAPRVRTWAALPWAGDAAIAAVLVLLAVPGSDVVVVLAFVPLLVTLAAGGSLAARALGSPPAHWLGVMSYAIYLLHRPLDEVLRMRLDHALAALHVPHPYSVAGFPTAAAVLLIAPALHRWVEQPARDAVRRLAGGRRPALATT